MKNSHALMNKLDIRNSDNLCSNTLWRLLIHLCDQYWDKIQQDKSVDTGDSSKKSDIRTIYLIDAMMLITKGARP